MAKSYCNLLYHIVFSTKKREPWLEDEMRERTLAYLGGAVRDLGGVALIVNGTADHVHILARLRQEPAVSDIIRDVKSNSSGWFHRTFGRTAFAWQSGYGAFTVSHSQVLIVRRYIERQEEHHRAVPFKTEFIALLDRHEVEYGERYVFD